MAETTRYRITYREPDQEQEFPWITPANNVDEAVREFWHMRARAGRKAPAVVLAVTREGVEHGQSEWNVRESIRAELLALETRGAIKDLQIDLANSLLVGRYLHSIVTREGDLIAAAIADMPDAMPESVAFARYDGLLMSAKRTADQLKAVSGFTADILPSIVWGNYDD